MEDFGTVTGPGTVRIERLLPGPLERIWACLTESDRRGQWLAPGEMELRIGGRVELRFHHADLSAEHAVPEKFKHLEGGSSLFGHITRLDPPHLLAFTWGENGGDPSEVSFELSRRGAEVLLVLTHRRLDDRGAMISVASGWHTHLGILADHLAGREPRPFWSTHAQVEQEYARRMP